VIGAEADGGVGGGSNQKEDGSEGEAHLPSHGVEAWRGTVASMRATGVEMLQTVWRARTKMVHQARFREPGYRRNRGGGDGGACSRG